MDQILMIKLLFKGGCDVTKNVFTARLAPPNGRERAKCFFWVTARHSSVPGGLVRTHCTTFFENKCNFTALCRQKLEFLLPPS